MALIDLNGLGRFLHKLDQSCDVKIKEHDFTVTATVSSLTATAAVLDKTLAEIETAYQAGKKLQCKFVLEGYTGAVMNLTTVQRNTATGNFIFSGIGIVMPNNTTVNCYIGYVYITNTGAAIAMKPIS